MFHGAFFERFRAAVTILLFLIGFKSRFFVVFYQ